MPRLLLASLLSSALLLPGCFFYFGGDDDDCLYGGDLAEPVPDPGLRNPETGECQHFGGPGRPCDLRCGPCPAADEAPPPTWGSCESSCTGLDELACLDESGCRGIYTESCDGEACQLDFADCWATDTTGPIQGGECEGLDAYACSRHDDCIAIHHNDCSGSGDELRLPEPCVGHFDRCAAEPGDIDPGTCYGEVACDALPPECPPDTVPGIIGACWSGACIPVEECEPPPACSTLGFEAACVDRDDCTPLYQGIDCACDASGCGCSEWLFDRCEA